MIANLKTIVAATVTVGVLVTPVLAKSPHHIVVPTEASSTIGEANRSVQSVYAPNLRLPARPYQYGNGINPDFQLSHN